MPVRWKLFRIICVLQMIIASVYAIMALINVAIYGFWALLIVLVFVLIFLLAVLGINILNDNYPNTPVTGRQKTKFNRLFLLNFLFLFVLFCILFIEIRAAKLIIGISHKPVLELSYELFINLIGIIVTLVFQFIILYGLYSLRNELYLNFMKKQFEFEKDQA
jgi:hypothetical protein